MGQTLNAVKNILLNEQVIAYDYMLIKHEIQMSTIPRTWRNSVYSPARMLLKTEEGTETSYAAWFLYIHFPRGDNIELFVGLLFSGDASFWYVKMPAYCWQKEQNPEPNIQVALQISSEMPEYCKCARHTIACLCKKVPSGPSFQDHEILY